MQVGTPALAKVTKFFANASGDTCIGESGDTCIGESYQISRQCKWGHLHWRKYFTVLVQTMPLFVITKIFIP